MREKNRVLEHVSGDLASFRAEGSFFQGREIYLSQDPCVVGIT